MEGHKVLIQEDCFFVLSVQRRVNEASVLQVFSLCGLLLPCPAVLSTVLIDHLSDWVQGDNLPLNKHYAHSKLQPGRPLREFLRTLLGLL